MHAHGLHRASLVVLRLSIFNLAHSSQLHSALEYHFMYAFIHVLVLENHTWGLAYARQVR